jgi:Fe-S-cluster containining protein
MTDQINEVSVASSPDPTSIDFQCTECGKCCHGLRLPLTVTEAIAWLERAGTVELMCEAIPWQSEPEPDQLVAAHKRRRSFPAMSGGLPVRVIVVLAARFEDACPNLLPDQRCNIYLERPLVCRIYPAEINPFIALEPAHKGCPPEAWTLPQPLVRQGQVVDAQVWDSIQKSRASDQREAPLKAAVCTALGIDIAEFSSVGFAVHHPEPAALLEALRAVAASVPAEIARPDGGSEGGGLAEGPVILREAPTPEWRFSTARQDLMEALVSIGANVADQHAPSSGGARWERLSLS